MVAIINKTFNGIAPGVTPKLLADSLGVTAKNIVLDSGRIEALNNVLAEGTSVTSGTDVIFKKGSNWMEFADPNTKVVPSPIVMTEDDTFYISDENYPKVSWNSAAFVTPPYPTTSYRLGVPAPLNAPTYVVNGTADDQEETIDVAYVYTFVTADGREGPPSPASTITYGVSDNQTQDVTMPDTSVLVAPTNNHNMGAGALKRLYRTNVGSNGAAFQFVAEVALTSAVAYTDSFRLNQLQEVLPSIDWSGPPDDTISLYPNGPLLGLTNMGNGILAGFVGNVLWFSEPYLPHAFPVTYTIPIGFDIIGLAPSSDGLCVLTEGSPYLVSGTDPSALLAERLESQQSCVSANSIVAMDGIVMYASPDGLQAISGRDVTQVTADTHLRADWQSLNPDTLTSVYWEGKYLAFAGSGGFIFDPRGGLNAFTTTTTTIAGPYLSILEDKVYGVQATSIVEFNAGAAQTITWKSKIFRLNSATSLSCGQIDTDGTCTLKLFGDGVQVGPDIVVTNDTPFRLPSLTIYQEVQYQIEGSSNVNSVAFASSMQELRAAS